MYGDADTKIIERQLGTFQSPEHAEMLTYIFTDPWLFLLVATGKITQPVLDKAAADLKAVRERQRRAS